ncbi:small, acid-soluble spore protein, H family [Clostridium sp. P21]|uniref:Small, acid-soluble spore protein, H family n=1 Tax=Clostridium muellerianum TaxID=2716538 RepID=A0A7Y0ED08_9CLOT|nr:small, acid-soluble spore protein, H family [Clostridium muellerianum]NMM61224.1 small, acid-soluble spore protein, H family [Clostridium muellerianum]
MEIEKLKELIDSPANVEVLYRSHPVWIDAIDTGAQLAKIKILETKEKKYVPIEDLIDTGKVINIKR